MDFSTFFVSVEKSVVIVVVVVVVQCISVDVLRMRVIGLHFWRFASGSSCSLAERLTRAKAEEGC
jgi:hypothetical protein